MAQCPRDQRLGRLSPRQAGVAAAVVAAPMLVAVWLLVTFVLSFFAGATVGGYGAAAQGPTVEWIRWSA